MYDEDELRTFYDKDAARRDALDLQPWKKTERQHFRDELRARNAKTLLELGAGPGKDSLFFQQQGLAVTATDLSPEMVKLCRKKGLHARVMSYRKLEVAPGSFDAVYALNTLLHLPKKELPEVLAGIRKVLAPSGLFYMGVYGGMAFEGIYDEDTQEPKRFFSFWEDKPLLELVLAYFDLVYFRKLDLGAASKLPFQSLILQKA